MTMTDDVMALYKEANKDVVDIIEKYNLASRNKKRGVVYKRYYLYHLLARKRYLTLNVTGKFFERDHTTVLHGINLHDHWWRVQDKSYLSEVNSIHEMLTKHKIDDDLYGLEIQNLGEEQTKVTITGSFDWRILEKLPERISKEELIKIFKRHGENERNLHSDNE